MIEYIDETAGKLDTRLIEHQKSVQACDLKSTVSKHIKDSGHSIDWASVKIFSFFSGKNTCFYARSARP